SRSTAPAAIPWSGDDAAPPVAAAPGGPRLGRRGLGRRRRAALSPPRRGVGLSPGGGDLGARPAPGQDLPRRRGLGRRDRPAGPRSPAPRGGLGRGPLPAGPPPRAGGAALLFLPGLGRPRARARAAGPPPRAGPFSPQSGRHRGPARLRRLPGPERAC